MTVRIRFYYRLKKDLNIVIKGIATQKDGKIEFSFEDEQSQTHPEVYVNYMGKPSSIKTEKERVERLKDTLLGVFLNDAKFNETLLKVADEITPYHWVGDSYSNNAVHVQMQGWYL